MQQVLPQLYGNSKTDLTPRDSPQIHADGQGTSRPLQDILEEKEFVVYSVLLRKERDLCVKCTAK